MAHPVATRPVQILVDNLCLVGGVFNVESNTSYSGEPRCWTGRQCFPRIGQRTHASDDDRDSVAVSEVTRSRVNVDIQGRQCLHAAAEVAQTVQRHLLGVCIQYFTLPRSDRFLLTGYTTCSVCFSSSFVFLPERDCVTFGSLLSQFRLSVCRLSVTFVRRTQRLTLSAKFLHRCVRWPSSDLRAKFYGDRPRGTPPSGALNARGVTK